MEREKEDEEVEQRKDGGPGGVGGGSSDSGSSDKHWKTVRFMCVTAWRTAAQQRLTRMYWAAARYGQFVHLLL